MQFDITKRLLSAFGLTFIVMLVLAGTALKTVTGLNAEVVSLTQVTAVGIAHSGNIQHLVAQLQSRLGQMVIVTAKADAAGIASTGTQIDNELRELQTAVDALERLVTDSGVRAECRAIRDEMTQWANLAAKIKGFAAGGQALEAADAGDAASRIAARASAAAAKIAETQDRALAQARASADSQGRWNLGVMIAVMLAAAGAAVFVMWTLRQVRTGLRQIATKLRETAEQVVSAAGQVATASQSLSHGATQQAASLEETSASMEEMASMTHNNADNSLQAAELMHGVQQQVERSNEMLQDMVVSMGAIKESSAKVSRIIKTIDEIAFQTNILALNAAVEAARAGEAGMGFAVVADEVRSLAQRAAQAARDTATLIEEASTSADQGSAKVEQVARAINAFTETVARVKALSDEVNVASRQQAQGIGQVSSAVAQMEKVTQTTAATAEESAAASEQLNAQAEDSIQAVHLLELMVGATAAHEAARPARTRRAAANVLPLKAQHGAKGNAGRGAHTPHAASHDASGTFGSF